MPSFVAPLVLIGLQSSLAVMSLFMGSAHTAYTAGAKEAQEDIQQRLEAAGVGPKEAGLVLSLSEPCVRRQRSEAATFLTVDQGVNRAAGNHARRQCALEAIESVGYVLEHVGPANVAALVAPVSTVSSSERE